jgi:hypothetical protein
MNASKTCPCASRVGIESCAAPIEDPKCREIRSENLSQYSGVSFSRAAAKAPEVMIFRGFIFTEVDKNLDC